MAYLNRTYRMVDGERIEGSFRPIFIKNGSTYFLTELKVYADGMIDCWGLVDLPTFGHKVESGWVATTLKQGATASMHHLGSWKFEQPHVGISAEMLVAEVRDEIEHLAGRPTAADRCIAALDQYLIERNATNLSRLREAYFNVPAHLRTYLLGDMILQPSSSQQVMDG